MQICTLQAAVVVPKNATISAVFTFGDSILDTGNNNHLITLVKSNFLPYGRDFMGGKPTGRFSNGKVPSDIFAQQLGIKELLPAFLDPNLQLQDLIGGVNFASAGAGFDPLTSELVFVIPMSKQLRLFDEYKRKLKSFIGKERADSIVADGLYIVSAGSDDIANTYFHTPTRIFDYNVSSYTELLARSASSFLQELHAKGARRIGVFSLAPLGCIPSQRTLAGGLKRRCAEDYNRMVQLLNSKLMRELRRLNSAFPHARMALIDVYGLLLDIMKNPRKYGFEISDRGVLRLGSNRGRVYVQPVEFLDMLECLRICVLGQLSSHGKCLQDHGPGAAGEAPGRPILMMAKDDGNGDDDLLLCSSYHGRRLALVFPSPSPSRRGRPAQLSRFDRPALRPPTTAMDPIASFLESLQRAARSAHEFVSGVVHRRDGPARRRPIEILKRLQREAFSDIMKLRDRQDKVERVLTFYKASKDSPFQEASTHVRGEVDVLGAGLWYFPGTRIRTGIDTKFTFETTVREKDVLMAQFVAGQRGREDVNGFLESPPLSLAKVLYKAHLSDWFSVMAVPIGAQCRDVGVIPSCFHQGKGLTENSCSGPPLINHHSGSAIGLTRLSNRHLSCGPLSVPISLLKQDRDHATFGESSSQTMGESTEGYVSSGSVALMLESELDEDIRLGAWTEMKRSNPKRVDWAVSLSDDCNDELGWGLSLSGTSEGRSRWDRFQAESYIKFNMGKKFNLRPGVVHVIDGNARLTAFMVRSNWSF
ncbi:hypothetical protein NL676_024499 [Syzygium grande]|nr:hypothetical protein NL676_024499 [Syzygium grande]